MVRAAARLDRQGSKTDRQQRWDERGGARSRVVSAEEDGPASRARVEPGDFLGSRYLIERVIGLGGTAVVLAAWDVECEVRVAIKVPSRPALANSTTAMRFFREAEVAERVASDHVARVHDVATKGERPFIAYEYLSGADLADVLAARERLPIAEAVSYLLEACDGLARAHALGIVHRDIKPENLFLTVSAGRPAGIKVIDFGIAKLGARSPEPAPPDEDRAVTSADQLALTSARAILGSPRYMPPEQLHDASRVDARADIWALGAVLYELVTGRAPFEAETLPDLCYEILTAAPIPLRDLVPEAPAALEAIIDRCLSKSVDGRFPTVLELAEALEPFAA